MNHSPHMNVYSLREADICFALADSTRIDIVHALEKRPHNVNEITMELGIPQPMASRHLKILRERGLVHSTRHGVSVIYALTDPRVLQALALLIEISAGKDDDKVNQNKLISEEITI